MIRSVASALTLSLLLVVYSCPAAPPSLTGLSPPGGQRGQTVSVQCEGKFDWPIHVFSPGVEVEVADDPGRLDVTIPQELSADRIWFRLFNAEGASSLVPFLIGNVNELSEEEPNNTPQQAQAIEELPVVINGVLKSADVDCFLVQLEMGQSLVAAVDAHSRMGSPIDSIVQITDHQGFVLAENHDHLGLDPAVSFTASRSGPVIVRLFGFASEPNQTIALQGCDSCHYRLTLTTGPYAAHTLPLAVSSEDVDIQFAGWNLSPDLVSKSNPLGHPFSEEPHEAESPSSLRLVRDSWLGFANESRLTAGRRVRHVNIPTQMLIDRRLNDSTIPLDLPIAVTGRLQEDGQADRYTVELAKGDTLLVACEAHTLGLPTDPWLRLLDPEDKIVADVDDAAQSRDSLIRFEAKTEGPHTIVVMDRFRKGSSRHFYLLTTMLEQPDFHLVVNQDQIVLTGEEPVELPIEVLRQGGAGAIRVFVEGLPEGITATTVESSTDGETSKSVKLSLMNEAAEFSGPIRVVGEMDQPIPLRRVATFPHPLKTSFQSLWLTTSATFDLE